MSGAPPTTPTGLRGHLRRRDRLGEYVFDLLFAWFGIYSGVLYTSAPAVFRQTAVHEAFGNGAWVWLAGYLLGGLGIALGMWTGRAKIQVGALYVFATGALVNVIALAWVFHLLALQQSGLFVGAAVACHVRAQRIVKGRPLTVVLDPP